jgi:hypothetical protein
LWIWQAVKEFQRQELSIIKIDSRRPATSTNLYILSEESLKLWQIKPAGDPK